MQNVTVIFEFLKFLFSKIMNIDVVYITDVLISHLMIFFFFLYKWKLMVFLRVAHDLLVKRYLLFLICDVVKIP